MVFADYDCTSRASNLKSPGVVSGGRSPVAVRRSSKTTIESQTNRVDGTLLLPRFSGPPRGSRRDFLVVDHEN